MKWIFALISRLICMTVLCSGWKSFITGCDAHWNDDGYKYICDKANATGRGLSQGAVLRFKQLQAVAFPIDILSTSALLNGPLGAESPSALVMKQSWKGFMKLELETIQLDRKGDYWSVYEGDDGRPKRWRKVHKISADGHGKKRMIFFVDLFLFMI